MRANLFLSALFAVSLVGGSALAERPTDGESRQPTREPKALDLKPHETTVRERATPERPASDKTSHAPASIREFPPTRADNVDRTYSAHGLTATGKAERAGATGVPMAMEKYKAARNCSDTGGDCSAPRGKSTGNVSDADKAAKTQEKHEITARERANVEKMVGMLHMMMCEHNALACAEYL